MHNRKRRARTGCLTCRARRVKCDEQVPECMRCAVANVVCAGYEQQRVVVPVKPKDRSRAERQAASSSTLSIHQNQQQEHAVDILPQGRPLQIRSVAQDPVVTVIGSQVPLAAFPSGPHPSQCPSLGARHVLGYHQVLLRTIPMLFPPEHLQFWRDELLQKAWGCEFLYLTFVALGNVHRAALMTLTGDDRGRTNGLDMKITAVQLYTQALEGMAKHLEEAKKTPSVLVATLCLMAYFESFCGNIPAFIGRIQAANYYCLTLLLVPMNVDLPPLRDCLRSLSHNCYVTLPLDIIQRTTEPHLDEYCFDAMDPERSSSTSRMALESLINMISDHSEIKELMWSPIAAYSRAIPARTLIEFERKLVHWRDSHLEIIPELDTESALRALLVYGWSQFAIPPSPYTAITPIKSLAAAYYSFFRARIRWALVLLDEDVLRNKPTAEFYFYEALRHAASHAVFLTTKGNDENTYMPCEALKVGLLPVLHIIGLCSPQPLWLKWIHDLSDRISQEGVLKGHTFATSLDCLHKFEMHSYDGASPAKMERYPDPAERIICQLIPETDGRHFVAYFAAPVAALDPRHAGLDAYEVIGEARWACGYEDGPCTPVVTVYDNGQTNLKTFSKEWLYNTQPVIEWLSWSQEREFCIERAVQDHISGTRLLLAAEGVINNKETET